MEGRSPGKAAPDEAVSDADARGVLREQARVAKLTEIQKADRELREELQKARDDYNMATGNWRSKNPNFGESNLKRKCSKSSSQSEKISYRPCLPRQEVHRAQRKIFSLKFCSLREEWKHEEMMMTIEKENCSLQQVVTEQESKLAEQNKLISELQGTVSQLQAEVLTSRYHIHKQHQAQEVIQSQAETLQHRELQTRVALECITSRKIINERMEFHQMLKQKGVKVPSLYSIDTSTSSPTSAKGRRKSPARQNLLTPEK
ncbi:coiled-coil domain-containing protein 27 isoform X3 [Calonectris borealis]|uniref:coiled-coil domain-containing protein 27 isoform X3 n=1 Tax=Calonectris borealis TaxID=1323832 RepID=UPI003F4BBB56